MMVGDDVQERMNLFSPCLLYASAPLSCFITRVKTTRERGEFVESAAISGAV